MDFSGNTGTFSKINSHETCLIALCWAPCKVITMLMSWTMVLKSSEPCLVEQHSTSQGQSRRLGSKSQGQDQSCGWSRRVVAASLLQLDQPLCGSQKIRWWCSQQLLCQQCRPIPNLPIHPNSHYPLPPPKSSKHSLKNVENFLRISYWYSSYFPIKFRS